MTHKEDLPAAEFVLSSEDEKHFRELIEAVGECLFGVAEILASGDRVPLHASTFEQAEQYQGEVRCTEIIRAAAFRELGVTMQGLTTVREDGNEKQYATNRPELVLGTDGEDWWVELA